MSTGGCRRSDAPSYVTATARRGDVQDVITATGQIEARTKINVGSQISGTVAKICVSYGDAVRTGQLLAELDPRLFAAQLARAEASVALAEAGLRRAEVEDHDRARSLARVAHLKSEHLAAQAELDSAQLARDLARAALAGARAQRVQARADRDLAAANLAFTRIASPIDGVVLDRQVDVGQTVAAQFQVATLFTIAADMRQVQLVANVDEADVGKLRAGMPARFRVAAYPGRDFVGTVAQVRPAPTVVAGGSAAVVTYAAVVQADNLDGALRQGMTAELTAVIAEARDVVRVPSAALRWRPAGAGKDAVENAARSGGESTARRQNEDAPDPRGEGADSAASQGSPDRGAIYLKGSSAPVRREVTLGLSDGQFVAVTAGLAADEVVIVGEMPTGRSKRPR